MSSEKEEREYLDKLASEADDVVQFRSNEMRPERERKLTYAFLRCLGVEFKVEEIKSSNTEPVDVDFRSARFQLIEILENDRRPHEDWRQRRKRYRNARSLKDLLDPYHSPKLIEYRDVVRMVTEPLAKKSKRYGENECAKLDALAYLNLENKDFDRSSSFVNPNNLIEQGWRSVSVFANPCYAIVLLANDKAPSFLQDSAGRAKSECKDLNVLFEL